MWSRWSRKWLGEGASGPPARYLLGLTLGLSANLNAHGPPPFTGRHFHDISFFFCFTRLLSSSAGQAEQ